VNLRKPASAAIALAACLFVAGAAHATTFDVTGSWSAILDGEGYTNEPFTGTASFTYSDAAITGSGFEDVVGSLTAFSLSPNPLGVTTFDLSNTGFFVRYLDGALHQIIVGGLVGTTTAVAQNTDDFYAVENLSSTNVIVVSTAATISTLLSLFEPDATVDFTVTPVPEPAGLALLLAGAPLLLRRRRTPS
jgi:MYXO-CTERM domain-containing protein